MKTITFSNDQMAEMAQFLNALESLGTMYRVEGNGVKFDVIITGV